MKDSPPKRYPRFRQFRILTILVLTAAIAIPIAVLTNGKSAFERDQRAILEISEQLVTPFGWPSDKSDSFGFVARETFSVERAPTSLGELSGISFLKRATAIHLHSDECAGKIPNAVARLDLVTLILRGEFDEQDIAVFQKTNPGVKVVTMD